jgi:hypothetical protein
MEKSSELDYVDKTYHVNRRMLNVEGALFVTMATINLAKGNMWKYILHRLLDT